MILLLDNYDSFVFNLARYFERLGQDTLVVRSDRIEVDAIERQRPEAIVISPGPCTPDEAGCSLDVVRKLHDRVPMLGVCLGHQAIAQAFGGIIIRAAEPMHGQACGMHHEGGGLFERLPNPFLAGRYHSLLVDPASFPPELRVTARTESGLIMALAHRRYPVVGVQFHPESVLTEHGYRLLANFVTMAGLAVPRELPSDSIEPSTPRATPSAPLSPVPY